MTEPKDEKIEEALAAFLGVSEAYFVEWLTEQALVEVA